MVVLLSRVPDGEIKGTKPGLINKKAPDRPGGPEGGR